MALLQSLKIQNLDKIREWELGKKNKIGTVKQILANGVVTERKAKAIISYEEHEGVDIVNLDNCTIYLAIPKGRGLF